MSVAAVHLVETATQEYTPAHVIFPQPAWTVFYAFHKIHRGWSWYRKAEIYTNPNNFLQLGAGHALNLAAGDISIIRISAQALLITTRILECVKQKSALYRGYCKWMHAVKGHYVMPVRCKWEKRHNHSQYISPSTVQWWQSTKKTTWTRVHRIAMSSLNVLKKAFKLSMRLMDAVEAFSLSPTTKNESLNEFFVNGNKCLNELVENKGKLKGGLSEHKALIDKIMIGVGAPYKADFLINAVSKALDKTDDGYQTAGKASAKAQNVLKDMLKRGIFGFMTALGLAEYTPDMLVPTLDPPWVEAEKKQVKPERYPPIEWITRIKRPKLPSLFDEESVPEFIWLSIPTPTYFPKPVGSKPNGQNLQIQPGTAQKQQKPSFVLQVKPQQPNIELLVEPTPAQMHPQKHKPFIQSIPSVIPGQFPGQDVYSSIV